VIQPIWFAVLFRHIYRNQRPRFKVNIRIDLKHSQQIATLIAHLFDTFFAIESAVEGCGRQVYFENIVGGQEVPFHTLPWMVQLYQVFTIRRNGTLSTQRAFLCGGSLISPQHILTAGHCVYRTFGALDASHFQVKIGASRLSDNGTFYSVDRVYAHENYRSMHRYADIAMLKLAQPVAAQHQRFVCLPSAVSGQRDADLLSRSKPLLVAGWGVTQFLGHLSDQLRGVHVQLFSNSDCTQKYSRLDGFGAIYPQGVDDRFICAGNTSGGRDACQVQL
jgi:secreted trypsin-like serine protease